jgi:hypothetical protein
VLADRAEGAALFGSGSDIPGFLGEGGAEIHGVTDYRLVFTSIPDL